MKAFFAAANCPLFDLLIATLAISGFVLLASLIVLNIVILDKIVRNLWNKSDCHIYTDVSVSGDSGTSYTKNFCRVNPYRKPVYLQYTITAKRDGFLSKFFDYEISFKIEIPKTEDMSVSLHECSSICCKPFPTDGYIITRETEFYLHTARKKARTGILRLRCEPKLKSQLEHANTFYVFNLKFTDEYLRRRYSKTIALDFSEYS